MKRFRDRKKEKLYQQWAKYSALPPEAIPQEEPPPDKSRQRYEEAPPDKSRQRYEEAPPDKNGRSISMLYVLLAIAVLVLCVGIALVVIQSC